MTNKTRTEAKADRFQYLPVRPQPASSDDVSDALRSFVQSFVAKPKRERARLLLLDPVRRDQAIRELWRWLRPELTRELGGSIGFPQNIAAVVGEQRGIFIADGQCVFVTTTEAAVMGTEDALFVSDDRSLALLFGKVRPPLLCTRH